MKFGDEAFVSRLRSRSIVGTFVGIAAPGAVEVMAWRGFEVVCIDSEHAALGPELIEQMIRAADAAGAEALVRVSGLSPEIGRALDSGACGVVVPHVETAEQARACVTAVRYPPVGDRGAGPGRVTGYAQRIASYLGEANDNVALVVQVETALGVENAAEIAAVDGVDVVFVGPGDLAVSMGVAMGSPEHSAAVEHVLTTVRDAGKISGIFSLTGDDVPRWAALGAKFYLLSSDLGFLGMFAGAELARVEKLLAETEASR